MKEEREGGKEVRSTDNDYGRQKQEEARHTHLRCKEEKQLSDLRGTEELGQKELASPSPHPTAALLQDHKHSFLKND